MKDTEGKLRGFAKLTRDITELRRGVTNLKMQEAALHAAEKAKYQALFENNRDAIFLTRPKDGAVLAVNPAACSLFGYSEQELLSMNRDALLDVCEPRFTQAWAERAATGEVEAELTFIRRDGVRLEARVLSKLFTDESGCQVAYTSIHDITERKQAEEALRQSEELSFLYGRAAWHYTNRPNGCSPANESSLKYRVTQRRGCRADLSRCTARRYDRIAKIAEDLLFGR